MNKMRNSFIFGLTLTLCIMGQAQIDSRLTYRRFVTQDGLPQMQTERLWQDSRGYIYIGTLSGFVRYDGLSFTPFLKGKRFNIVGFCELGNQVRALGFFRQWTVTYDDAKPLPLDPQGHWLLNNINAGCLPNGYVLVEDSLEQQRRLCRMTKSGLKFLITDPLLDKMTPDRKILFNPTTSEAFVPLESGVYLVKSKEKKVRRILGKDDVFTLLQTDSCLMAFASDGIYTLKHGTMQHIAQADWSAASYGLTVRTLHSGELIIADEHNVYIYGVNGIHQIMSGINLIRDVMVDRWDRLWVATYQGVYCFFTRCFTNHTLTDENDIVRAVTVNKDGQIVMGSLNGKIIMQDPNGELTIISDDPEQFYAPSAVTIGDKSYLAGNGDIVSVSTTGKCERLGLPRDRYQFVVEAWGQLVIGTRNSILAYNPNSHYLDTLTTDILHPWCAASDNSGQLWVGSSSGLYKATKTQRHKNTKTEFSKFSFPQKLVISAMHADSKGNIFFASADSLFLIKNGQVRSLNHQIPQLNGHEVRALHVSPRHCLVIATVDGLFLCQVNTHGQLSNVLFFNQLNGFTMTEPLKATIAESNDGTLWMPGVEQMTSFRPADLFAAGQADTYISPPLRWWQHGWVGALALIALATMVWSITRWYEKKRNRTRMIRLQQEKQQREHMIESIRQKAVMDATNQLAKDILKITDKNINERISLRTTSGTIVRDIKDIAFFKADGNYAQMTTFQGATTVLISLAALEKMLNPDIFVRADRSSLVNIHHISSLLPKQRRCIFRSPDGVEVETSLLVPAFKRLQKLI